MDALIGRKPPKCTGIPVLRVQNGARKKHRPSMATLLKRYPGVGPFFAAYKSPIETGTSHFTRKPILKFHFFKNPWSHLPGGRWQPPTKNPETFESLAGPVFFKVLHQIEWNIFYQVENTLCEVDANNLVQVTMPPKQPLTGTTMAPALVQPSQTIALARRQSAFVPQALPVVHCVGIRRSFEYHRPEQCLDKRQNAVSTKAVRERNHC